MGGADKLVRSYSKKKASSSRYSAPVKWALYLEDMSVILFAFHLVRENIELASTNGMFKFAGSVRRMCEVDVRTALLLRNGGRKERRLQR